MPGLIHPCSCSSHSSIDGSRVAILDSQRSSGETVDSNDNFVVDQCSSVDFQLSAKDLRAWGKYVRTHNADGTPKVPATRGLRALVLLVAAMIGFMLYSRPVQIQQPKPAAPPLNFELSKWLPMMIVVALFIGLVWIVRYRLFKNAAQDSFLKSGRFVLSPSSIHIHYNLAEVKLLWDAIRRIVVINDHLFFIVAPSEAFVVPRRSFRDAAQFTEFLKIVQQCYPGQVIKE